MTGRIELSKTGAWRALVAACAMLAPVGATADQVSLKSSDGTVNLVGTLTGFEENTYIMRTGLGELRVDASLVRCEGDACPTFQSATADVVIAGSDTMGLGMMPLLLDGYAGFLDAEATETATANPSELLSELVGDQGFGETLGSYLISSTGSSDAFEKLLKKETQIGMSARRILPTEAQALRRSGAGAMLSPQQEHILAVDSLVVIAHPSNPVDALSQEQLRGIYSGEITNWQEVGGSDLRITFVGRNTTSGTRAVFEERLFDGASPALRKDAVTAFDALEVATLVNEAPGALGYTGFAFQRGAKPLAIVNECGMRMSPDVFSAKTEEYPLQRRLYLYTRADNKPSAVEDFLAYATSEEADAVISKSGFISLGIQTKPQDLTDARVQALESLDTSQDEVALAQDMLVAMQGYDRLSTTFRFRSGSSRLDERASADMQRLVAFLDGRAPGTTVKVVGFSDSVGKFAKNRVLAEKRATQVRQMLESVAGDRIGGIAFETAGFGELAPAQCNDTERGRAINRRVEIWVERQAL